MRAPFSDNHRLRNVDRTTNLRFHSGRCDKFSAGCFEDFFFPVGDAQIPLRVEFTGIPGVKPAVPDNRGGGLRIAIVAKDTGAVSRQESPRPRDVQVDGSERPALRYDAE